jgi:hypothetical protein
VCGTIPFEMTRHRLPLTTAVSVLVAKHKKTSPQLRKDVNWCILPLNPFSYSFSIQQDFRHGETRGQTRRPEDCGHWRDVGVCKTRGFQRENNTAFVNDSLITELDLVRLNCFLMRVQSSLCFLPPRIESNKPSNDWTIQTLMARS